MERFRLDIQTQGNTDVINLAAELVGPLRKIHGDGLLNLFIPGSTAALTTLEYEPGLVKHDLPALFQKLAPDDARYLHEATWNDDNGHSHVRAALIGPSLTVPFADGKLLLGQWQQIVLIDFDTRPRRRSVICTVIP